MTTQQPDALRLAQHINDLFVSQWGMNSPMAKDSKIVLDELRRLHESNQELLAALKVAEVAIHEYRNLGAPHAYWDDVQYQAYTAIAKAERTTT